MRPALNHNWIWPARSHQHCAASLLWPFRASPNWFLSLLDFEVDSRKLVLIFWSPLMFSVWKLASSTVKTTCFAGAIRWKAKRVARDFVFKTEKSQSFRQLSSFKLSLSMVTFSMDIFFMFQKTHRRKHALFHHFKSPFAKQKCWKYFSHCQSKPYFPFNYAKQSKSGTTTYAMDNKCLPNFQLLSSKKTWKCHRTKADPHFVTISRQFPLSRRTDTVITTTSIFTLFWFQKASLLLSLPSW